MKKIIITALALALIVGCEKQEGVQKHAVIVQNTEKPDYVFLAAAKCGGIADNIKNPVAFFRENLEIQNNIHNKLTKEN